MGGAFWALLSQGPLGGLLDTSGGKTAKTSKITTLLIKINDFRPRKVAKMSQKPSQKKENRDNIAHHKAKSRRRAPSSHPRAPKGAQKEASDHCAHDLGSDFGARTPPGAPSRARGILDKSSKEE